ncbi:MAG: glycosyltransferase family 2 protein [Bacteroidales bacterium]|nr:glycosyltransferase family 2 protein [Bacteroidales bacterium]
MIQLQLQVCTLGLQGLERLARTQRPQVDGVEYLVSCQLPIEKSAQASANEDTQASANEDAQASANEAAAQAIATNQAEVLQMASDELKSFLQREDVKLHIIHSRGVSKNRNNALSLATAPLSLLSDDDVDYTAEGLQAIIQAFEQAPQADVISFQFWQGEKQNQKFYPDKAFHHQHPPKGFYISVIEIAFRTKKVQAHCRFNENFGIGAEHFPSGEEDILLKDMLKAGLNCVYEPICICSHPSLSTGTRRFADPAFLQCKGAIFSYIHPNTWLLRLVKGAITEGRKKRVSPWIFLSNTLKGVCLAKRLKVFSRR